MLGCHSRSCSNRIFYLFIALYLFSLVIFKREIDRFEGCKDADVKAVLVDLLNASIFSTERG